MRILLSDTSIEATVKGVQSYAAVQAEPRVTASLELCAGPEGWVELRFPPDAPRWHFHVLAGWLSAPIDAPPPGGMLLVADEPAGVSYWLEPVPGPHGDELAGATSDARPFRVYLPTGAVVNAPPLAVGMPTSARLQSGGVPPEMRQPMDTEAVTRIDLPLHPDDVVWKIAPFGPPAGVAPPSAFARFLSVFTGR